MSARHILFVEPDQTFRRQMVSTLQNQGLDTVRCRIRQHGIQLKTNVVLAHTSAPSPRRRQTKVGGNHSS